MDKFETLKSYVQRSNQEQQIRKGTSSGNKSAIEPDTLNQLWILIKRKIQEQKNRIDVMQGKYTKVNIQQQNILRKTIENTEDIRTIFDKMGNIKLDIDF